ncbi:hypothetical protein Rsub_11944 [Raphidocelis subcapitata]|uniref:Alginate lyase domain-containing protein n=1 Tax=Raphidocelis subcapitata TaxID=307507 RepID=A0A2V0PI27_9CHLO|nr:hypothetical protein Rsub_11944 [Raphidocelis subcapitata]|eukprot:GBF99458.1 hypothetical protein Rsub_11944 [Raphidocelis subcapitata]
MVVAEAAPRLAGRGRRGLLLVVLVVALFQRPSAAQMVAQASSELVEALLAPLGAVDDLIANCNSEWQLVMCGEIPFTAREDLAHCCARYAPEAGGGGEPAASADTDTARAGALAVTMGGAPAVPRLDLDAGGYYFTSTVDLFMGRCTPPRTARLPVFSRDAQGRTQVEVQVRQFAGLNTRVIKAVKKAAIRAASKETRSRYNTLNRTKNGFNHPGTYASALELAATQTRLASQEQLQAMALNAMVTGDTRWVPVKRYGSWSFRVDTPADGYGGPFASAEVSIDYGGATKDSSQCSPAYLATRGPASQCHHIALVEIDGAMAYRQALAFLMNGNEGHAAQARAALVAWANTNRAFGLQDRNGPLEAAWAAGAYARAAELLRSSRYKGFSAADAAAVTGWLRGVLKPQMDYYVDVMTPNAVNAGRKNIYGNWHASIADAYIAIGVFANDAATYRRGLALFRTTVAAYFRWGRGADAAGRIVGEATETLRDIYHTEFALGSLLQAAEAAWAQDTDLYAENEYALAAALELHARIIIGALDSDEATLPPGFKLNSSMPAPPSGCTWRWDIETQKWASYRANPPTKCSDLLDGAKYVLGAKYMPTGFEIGYNHYAGRLGMPMPETAALLRRYPLDYFEFSWGAATLTHAGTAPALWRAGISDKAVCGRTLGRRR